MSFSIRLALFALIAVLFAGTLAICSAYRSGALASQSVLEVATTGDLRGLFPSHDAPDSAIADLTLRRLESDYYKPISPQTPLAGESSALRTLLNSKRLGSAALPNESAVGDSVDDGARAASLLSFAQAHYGNALGTAGVEDLTDAALRGIMNSVHDPYTVYLSPREIQGLNELLSGGNFGGIGVYIYQLKDGRIIVQPIEQMPAAKVGMKPGEIIDRVNGHPVRGLPIDRVEGMIRGEPGTTVRLQGHPVNAPARERTYAIVRETIVVPTVRAKMEARHRLHPALPTSARRRPTKCAPHCSTVRRRARTATFSTCATTAAVCSTQRSLISSLFVDARHDRFGDPSRRRTDFERSPRRCFSEAPSAA